MAAGTVNSVIRGPEQFRGVAHDCWKVRGTLDVASLADGVGTTDTFTVPGVALGDAVAMFSCSVDLAGISVTAYVSAANTVSFRIQNESASPVDLASATWKFVVVRFSF